VPSDSDPQIALAPVTEENQGGLVQRHRRRKMHKAFLKAKDRRKNFERGELAGFLYCIGLCAVVVAASGQLNHYPLDWWQRILMALLGVVALTGKTYTKRRFWKQTEDAEYQEEDEDDGTD
jgi:hypothetical protein